MKITEVKIRKLYDSNRLRAVVSIILDDCIALHDIKVIEGDDRKFVAMPSRKEGDGKFRDIVHPINVDMRIYIEKTILEEYENLINKNGTLNKDSDIVQE